MGRLLEKLHEKLELYRLEQKYILRKNRTTFTTGATYVDGEYVYSNGSSPALSTSSTGSSGVSRRGGGMGKRTALWMGGS